MGKLVVLFGVILSINALIFYLVFRVYSWIKHRTQTTPRDGDTTRKTYRPESVAHLKRCRDSLYGYTSSAGTFDKNLTTPKRRYLAENEINVVNDKSNYRQNFIFITDLKDFATRLLVQNRISDIRDELDFVNEVENMEDREVKNVS